LSSAVVVVFAVGGMTVVVVLLIVVPIGIVTIIVCRRFHLPSKGAIRQKMASEGLSGDRQDAFFRGELALPAPPGTTVCVVCTYAHIYVPPPLRPHFTLPPPPPPPPPPKKCPSFLSSFLPSFRPSVLPSYFPSSPSFLLVLPSF
jgi:hypothetical protein